MIAAVRTSSCPPRLMICVFCPCGFPASSARAFCFASPKRVPARMLKEWSSTIRSSRKFASAVAFRSYGFANASTTSSTNAHRSANSTRYLSLRWRVELCVPRSKNIRELTGRGVAWCRRSRCTNTGTPSAASPPRNHGARKPFSYPPAATRDIRATPDRAAHS